MNLLSLYFSISMEKKLLTNPFAFHVPISNIKADIV